MEETGSEALDQLAEAIGQPPPSVSENAKALFPFIAHEALMEGELVDSELMGSEQPVGVTEDTPCDSACWYPATPGR